MLELEDILGKEELILIDSSMSSMDQVDFAREIYEAKHFDQLDPELIRRKISEYRDFAEILAHPSSYTIRGVTYEIKKFEEIVNAKIAFASFIPLTGSRRRRQIEVANERPERLMHQLQEEVYEARRSSFKKEIHRYTGFKEIEGLRYELLLAMTKLVSGEICLKRDTSYLFGERDKDRSGESDTDEKLVATLYWLSLSGRSPCLLSQDTDFSRLFGVVTRIIGSDSFLPYNEEFRKGVIECPFRVYIRNVSTRECGLSIDGSKTEYRHRFWIGDIDPERNDEIKHQIFQMWRKFASIQ